MAEAFPEAVRYLLTPQDFRRDFILEMVRPRGGKSEGYHALADLVYRQLCWTVLTTNFDTLIADSLRDHQPYIKRIVEINKTGDDFIAFNVHNRAQIVYLHGAAEYYTDRILVEETEQLTPRLTSSLRSTLRDAPLVVVGYRGAESSVMKHLLIQGVTDAHYFTHGIWWCSRSGEKPHPYVEELARQIKTNFKIVEIKGFDELMLEVSQELKSDYYFSANPSTMYNGSLAFDEAPLEDKCYDDLDEDLIKTTLTKYCSRLEISSVDPSKFQMFLIEQGFLIEINHKIVPTNATYLLFGKNPNDRFPCAKVAFEKEGKQRTVFEGNLLTQFRSLIDFLSNTNVNPLLRVKKEKTSEERQAYPARAITELVVNMLVHRDYSIQEFGKISYVPGTEISFVTPGGLPEKVMSSVTLRDGGKFEPIRNLSQIRNRFIADVFYGIGSMDKAGSGMSDVRDLMLSFDGRAEFWVRDKNSSLVSVLVQAAQQAPEISNVATPVVKSEVYTTNLLPFALIPQELYLIPFDGEHADVEAAQSQQVPIYIVDWKASRKAVITFADLTPYAQYFPSNMDFKNQTSIPVDQFLLDKDRNRRFVWLLGRHLEEYIREFESDGLLQDHHKKRAYFGLLQGIENRINYLSRLNRRVSRSVVKRRVNGKYVYHENEGITYAIESYGSRWSLRLKPFYMFTGKDGVTPLPAFRRTKYATWRIKYDKNKNVDDDLHFWVKYLARGESTLNIGGKGVQNLLLEASYIECEVPLSMEE